MPLRVLEHYVSVQGEGPNTGKPIQFFRLAGCNMRCPGWPCDTPQAIFPAQFTDRAKVMSVDEAVMEVAQWPAHICITGGEPLLQRGTVPLMRKLLGYGYHLDLFTNGSFVIPEDLVQRKNLTIVMDWKLPGSREHQTALPQRWKNAMQLTPQHAIKFVIKNELDYEAARVAHEEMRVRSVRAQIWAGVVWGEISEELLVCWMLRDKQPWHLNVQTHKFVWDPKETGV